MCVAGWAGRSKSVESELKTLTCGKLPLVLDLDNTLGCVPEDNFKIDPLQYAYDPDDIDRTKAPASWLINRWRTIKRESSKKVTDEYCDDKKKLYEIAQRRYHLYTRYLRDNKLPNEDADEGLFYLSDATEVSTISCTRDT